MATHAAPRCGPDIAGRAETFSASIVSTRRLPNTSKPTSATCGSPASSRKTRTASAGGIAGAVSTTATLKPAQFLDAASIRIDRNSPATANPSGILGHSLVPKSPPRDTQAAAEQDVCFFAWHVNHLCASRNVFTTPCCRLSTQSLRRRISPAAYSRPVRRRRSFARPSSRSESSRDRI